MNKLDEFAKAAMQTCIPFIFDRAYTKEWLDEMMKKYPECNFGQIVAKESYNIAEYMMEESEKRNKSILKDE